MPTYITLLRGINMAGHKIIKMDKLRQCFETLKFKNVRTYIQSGNVLFESSQSKQDKLTSTIEKGLQVFLGHEIKVFIRTIKEFEEIAGAKAFKNITTHLDSKMFVTFLTESVKPKPKVPLWSNKRDVEVLEVAKREFFSLSHEVYGRFGFPNLFIEKTFKVPATTRNWRTINKLVEFANK